MTRKRIKLLYIDDQPDFWTEFFEEEFNPLNCEIVQIDNDPKTIENIENDIIIIEDFDIVLCNIYGKKCGGIGIIYAENTIKEIRKKNKDIPIFVITSDGLGSSGEGMNTVNTLLTEFGVKSCGIRNGTSGTSMIKLCDKMKVCISNLQSADWVRWEWKNEEGNCIIQDGIIRDILNGKSDFLPSSTFNEKHRNFLCSLASATEDWRIDSAIQIWKTIWLEDNYLPFFPLFIQLAEAEFRAQFYDAYRDHVTHTIWVYLLGLYMYNQCSSIRDAIDVNFDFEDFLISWKVAALFHDIGYIFDVGVDNENDLFNSQLNSLNEIVKYPLYNLLSSRGVDFTKSDEDEIQKVFNQYSPPNITCLDQLEVCPLPGDTNKIFSCIENIIVPTDLGNISQDEPISSYSQFSKNNNYNGRGRSRNHGIISAQILLYQYHRLQYCISTLNKTHLPKSPSRNAQTYLKKIIDGSIRTNYDKIIHQAAAAIALHDIQIDWDPKLHDISKKDPYNLSFSDFHIDLQKNPLAFLLVLADTLQCWDRNQRKYLSEKMNFTLTNTDIHLQINKNIIEWSVKYNKSLKKQIIIPTDEIDNLSKKISINGKSDLSSIIKEAPFNN